MMDRIKRGVFLGITVGLLLGATTWLDFSVGQDDNGLPGLDANGADNALHAFGLLAAAFLWIWQVGPHLSPRKDATA